MPCVKSVPGIPCLYAYTNKFGLTRYFVKTQVNCHILRQNLSLCDKPTHHQLRNEALKTVQNLKKQNGQRKPFTEYIREYIDIKQLRPKTAQAYRTILSHYSFNDAHNADMMRLTLANQRNACQIAHTVNAFFKWLIQNHLPVCNPAANIKMPKPRTRSRVLTRLEIKAFYKALAQQDPETHLLGRLLLETGARISSILFLRIRDVQSDGLHLYNVKAGRAYKLAIPVSETTNNLIAQLSFNRNSNEQLILCNKFTIQSRIRKLLDKLFNTSSKERIVIHSLRHTAATYALQNKVPLNIVSWMLDHVSVNTTHSIYATLDQAQLNAGFKALRKAIDP